MRGVDLFRAQALGDVPHGFLGRGGGVSTGVQWGLNVGSGAEDPPEAIARNRAIAVESVLPGGTLVLVRQIHSSDTVTVTGPLVERLRPQADALVTKEPGLVLGIVTADCAPVLFADREAGIVGAAHAGWKGAIGGITDTRLAAMETLGARRDRIVAAIGPCIARASYEVDGGFFARFVAEDPENARFFADGRADHHQFDLEAYVAHRLARAGVGRVEALGLDTYSDPERFFSFRRATHRGEPDYGRQISLIAVAE